MSAILSQPKYVYTIAGRDYLLYAQSGLILGLRPGNERRRYKVRPSLIGWAQN